MRLKFNPADPAWTIAATSADVSYAASPSTTVTDALYERSWRGATCIVIVSNSLNQVDGGCAATIAFRFGCAQEVAHAQAAHANCPGAEPGIDRDHGPQVALGY